MSMDQIGQKQKAKRANRVKASAGARIGTTRRAKGDRCQCRVGR